jgi:hypothetical protein
VSVVTAMNGGCMTSINNDFNKPVLMLHEVNERILTLPLERYILTFDDGLYTQYTHLDTLLKIDTLKLFFISTGIVATEFTKQDPSFITCKDAHKLFKETGDLSHYMNWEQIQHISKQSKCILGAHSHMHGLDDSNIVCDTRLMMKTWEEKNLSVDTFCFPYNKSTPIYELLLRTRGFKSFYGDGRIDVDELITN